MTFTASGPDTVQTNSRVEGRSPDCNWSSATLVEELATQQFRPRALFPTISAVRARDFDEHAQG